jgi:hypothetical protein
VPNAPTYTLSASGNIITISNIVDVSNGSTITDYYYAYGVSGGTMSGYTDISSNVSTFQISGLLYVTNYAISMYSKNAIGSGSSTVNYVATTAGQPSAPSFTLSASGNIITVSNITDLSSNGSTITDYFYAYGVSGGTMSGYTDISSNVSTFDISGLAYATNYAVAIYAVNAIGSGSNAINNYTTADIKSNAPIFTLSPSDNVVTAEISIDSNNLGSPITYRHYAYGISGETLSTSMDISSSIYVFQITDLSYATNYECSMYAVNGAGHSDTTNCFFRIAPQGCVTMQFSITGV